MCVAFLAWGWQPMLFCAASTLLGETPANPRSGLVASPSSSTGEFAGLVRGTVLYCSFRRANRSLSQLQLVQGVPSFRVSG